CFSRSDRSALPGEWVQSRSCARVARRDERSSRIAFDPDPEPPRKFLDPGAVARLMTEIKAHGGDREDHEDGGSRPGDLHPALSARSNRASMAAGAVRLAMPARGPGTAARLRWMPARPKVAWKSPPGWPSRLPSIGRPWKSSVPEAVIDSCSA